MDLVWAQGAHYLGGGCCRFRLWAPLYEQIELVLLSPKNQTVVLTRDSRGYFQEAVQGVYPGQRYLYRLKEGVERPDPASRFQPEGVHGPSEVVDRDFAWSDHCWHGIPLSQHVLYELHVGLYTPQGTFESLIAQLDALRSLGVTAVELMPVAQFPGGRNWGYDGVYPYAAQNSYGGPDGLRRLVDAAHARQLAVVLDVVYNHLGPEGNYLHDYGPYFTNRYATPWGLAINYDGPYSDEVRCYFIGNALSWIEDYHIDGLRLDATHAIIDTSATHFLKELADYVDHAADKLNRRVYLFAESDLNDSRIVRSPELGGYGVSVQWNDDFHHALFTLLPGADAAAYLNDYGSFEQLVKSYDQGYVYTGEYSNYRKHSHGSPSRSISGEKLLVFIQNHDQVGNRPKGDRLSDMVPFETLKMAAGAYLLSPYIPLLFMGEEYGETVPFLYFVSHSDPQLVEAVRKGRAEEFAHYFLNETPPDPQSEATYERSRPRLALREQGQHKVLYDFYRELLRLRASIEALSWMSHEKVNIRDFPKEKVIVVRRGFDGQEEECAMILNLGQCPASVAPWLPGSNWKVLLDSASECWAGPGSLLPEKGKLSGEECLTLRPTSLILLEREIHP